MTVTFEKPNEIKSVADLAKRVSKIDKARLLFRGQNTDQPLKPKIARQRDFDAAVEQEMLERFKKESGPFLGGVLPQTDWDWLSVAQHQGMSTRLLDWSSNALAALWFAVSVDPPHDEDHGVVWMLRVEKDDLKSPDNQEELWDLRRTYVFQPFHIDRRIAAQSAWFSVHKYVEERGRFVSLDTNVAFKQKLKKFVVPRNSFVKIRKELRRMGVTRSSLFPDLGGLCADIDEEYLGERRNPADI